MGLLKEKGAEFTEIEASSDPNKRQEMIQRSGRRRAVSGAFAVAERSKVLIAGKRILLVDDVMTTGATADACARTLLRAGAKAVDVVVVAKVRDTTGLG